MMNVFMSVIFAVIDLIVYATVKITAYTNTTTHENAVGS